MWFLSSRAGCYWILLVVLLQRSRAKYGARAWVASVVVPGKRSRVCRAAYLGNLMDNHHEGSVGNLEDDDDDRDGSTKPSVTNGFVRRDGETSLIAMIQRLAAEQTAAEEARAPDTDAPTKDPAARVVGPDNRVRGALDSSIPREVERPLQVAAFARENNTKNKATDEKEDPIDTTPIKADGDLSMGAVEKKGFEVGERQDKSEDPKANPKTENISFITGATQKAKNDDSTTALSSTAAYMNSLGVPRQTDTTQAADDPQPTDTTSSPEEDLIQQHDAFEAHEAKLRERRAQELYELQLQQAFGMELSYPQDEEELSNNVLPDIARVDNSFRQTQEDDVSIDSKSEAVSLDDHYESANIVFESLDDLDTNTNRNHSGEDHELEEDSGDELVQLVKQLLLDIHLGFTDMKTAMVTLLEEDPALERNKKYWNWGLETGGASRSSESELLP